MNWDIRMSFDGQLTDLKAAILRVNELRFHPDAPTARREQVRGLLHGASGLIV